MGKRAALGFGLALVAGIVLVYILWSGPSSGDAAPQRPERRNPTKLLEKQIAPPAEKPREDAVPADALDRATRSPTRPAPVPERQPVYIKSSDIPEDNGMHWFILAAELMPDLLLDQDQLDQMFESGWVDPARSKNAAKPSTPSAEASRSAAPCCRWNRKSQSLAIKTNGAISLS